MFVSSEGSILPIARKSLTFTRCLTVVEVGDISDDEAICYLSNAGLPKELSKELVSYAGGRFVHLVRFIRLYRAYQRINPPMKDDQMSKLLKEELFSRMLNSQKFTIRKWQPTSRLILQAVSKRNEIEVFEIGPKGDEEKLEKVTKELVSENVLRYTVNGLITWHGRPQKQEFCLP